MELELAGEGVGEEEEAEAAAAEAEEAEAGSRDATSIETGLRFEWASDLDRIGLGAAREPDACSGILQDLVCVKGNCGEV